MRFHTNEKSLNTKVSDVGEFVVVVVVVNLLSLPMYPSGSNISQWMWSLWLHKMHSLCVYEKHVRICDAVAASIYHPPVEGTVLQGSNISQISNGTERVKLNFTGRTRTNWSPARCISWLKCGWEMAWGSQCNVNIDQCELIKSGNKTLMKAKL